MEMVRAFANVLVGLIFQYLLLERRFSREKTAAILAGGSLLVFAANLMLFLHLGFASFLRIYPLLINVPFFLLFALVSRHRGFKILFNFLSATSLCLIDCIFAAVIIEPFGGTIALEILVRLALAAPTLFLVWRYFRGAYLTMLNTLRRGWALFCIVPLCYYIYGYNAFMRVAGDGNYLEILQSIPVTLLVISAYAVIYIFFNQIKEQARKEGELELLRSQVTALTNHDNAIRAAWQETAFLHHAIVQAEALLRAGETEQAQELLECVPGQAGLECCCENMTLNTILSFYFNKARRAGIEVTATLDIPEVLPVDRTELACVFSNALENAIDACSNLPENAPKWLRVTCFSHPQFVMEISNPFCGEVVFDQQGFPLTKEGGRGIGTRSIAAFVRENNAIYDYEASNGVFSLRLLLKPQED